jgi:hypothetical protein
MYNALCNVYAIHFMHVMCTWVEQSDNSQNFFFIFLFLRNFWSHFYNFSHNFAGIVGRLKTL